MAHDESAITIAASVRGSWWQAGLRRPALVVWGMFLVLSPLYVVASGYPQPGDLLIFLLFPLAISGWNGRLNRSASRPLRQLVWFTLWVWCVDYTWAAVLGEWSISRAQGFSIMPLYYTFNFAVFLSALLLYQRYGELMLRFTVHVIFLALVVQVVASFLVHNDLGRGTVLFNNPNQLGFYALLAATLFALLHDRVGLGLLRSSIGMTCCAYLAVLSASRAAFLGIAILLVLQIFSSPRVIVLACLTAIGLATIGGPISDAIDNAKSRVESANQRKLSFAEERGYDRLWKFKEYTLLGAGEGDVARFVDTGTEAHEIHSSAASVLFSYGIVGAILFVLFIARVIRGASLRMAMFLVPPLVYTIAHQGLRFTMLWVLLAVFVALKIPIRQVSSPSPVS